MTTLFRLSHRTCATHRLLGLSYLARAFDAGERLSRGETQRLCPVCKRWLWHDEWGDKTPGQWKDAETGDGWRK